VPRPAYPGDSLLACKKTKATYGRCLQAVRLNTVFFSPHFLCRPNDPIPSRGDSFTTVGHLGPRDPVHSYFNNFVFSGCEPKPLPWQVPPIYSLPAVVYLPSAVLSFSPSSYNPSLALFDGSPKRQIPPHRSSPPPLLGSPTGQGPPAFSPTRPDLPLESLQTRPPLCLPLKLSSLFFFFFFFIGSPSFLSFQT